LNSDLYRIVYCSRNQIGGTSEEVADVLLSLHAAAESKNQGLNITGALLFHAGLFAQVLEGPQNAVEQLFSRIQLDNRHSGVTVAHRGPAAQRDFSQWSMAFGDGGTTFTDRGGTSRLSLAQAAINAVFANQERSGEKLLFLLKTLF